MKKRSDKYWKSKLTDEQYRVLREKGTEAPFSGAVLNNDKNGIYKCVACGTELFESNTKFAAPYPNEGWPSFSEAIKKGAVELVEDNSHGMRRTEINCANCGGHLGHLFDDGPAEKGGQHYCVNSVCLDFEHEDKK